MKATIIWSMVEGTPMAEQVLMEGLEPITTCVIDVPNSLGDAPWPDEWVLETLFSQTNQYEGPLWDRIKPLLPPTRTHTALSVGDYVVLDDRAYRCENVGWEAVSRVPEVCQCCGFGVDLDECPKCGFRYHKWDPEDRFCVVCCRYIQQDTDGSWHPYLDEPDWATHIHMPREPIKIRVVEA